MKTYLYSTDEKILLFEKIPFLSIVILAILLLMAGRKVNLKPLRYEVEKIKHVLIVLPDLYNNLIMDGAVLPDGFPVNARFNVNNLVRLQ